MNERPYLRHQCGRNFSEPVIEPGVQCNFREDQILRGLLEDGRTSRHYIATAKSFHAQPRSVSNDFGPNADEASLPQQGDNLCILGSFRSRITPIFGGCRVCPAQRKKELKQCGKYACCHRMT